MIKLYKNGVELTNFIVNAPYSDTLDDELDKANFQIKSPTRLSFVKNDKITIQVMQKLTSSSYQYLVNKVMCLWDYVETLEGGFWLYQLTLLSPTKLLEGFIINGMASTTDSSPITLLAQLENVISKIEAQISYEYECRIGIDNPSVNAVNFNLDRQTMNDDARVKMLMTRDNDFLWDGQLTVREILQDICDKVDCLIVAKDYTFSSGEIKSIDLDVIPRELQRTEILNTNNSIEDGGLNDISQVVKGLTIHRDSEFNVGNIISLTKNAVAKDNIQQEYLPARNTDLTIDDASKWHIITNEPIYTLNSVKVLVNLDNVGLRKEDSGGNQVYLCFPIRMTAELDITDYIVEKSVFDTLPLNTQKKRLYFVRGEKNIYGLYDEYKKNPLQSNTAMKNIFLDIVNSFPQYSNQGNFQQVLNTNFFGAFDNEYKTFTEAKNLTDITNNTYYQNYGSPSDIIPSNFSYTQASAPVYSKYTLFSVNYQPYCDSVVKIEKTGISSMSGNVKNLSVIKNQSDRTIDASKYYDSQQALINRMGNDEMTLECITDLTSNYSSIPLGQRTWYLGFYITMGADKWTIVKREISNYGVNKLKIKYYLSKNYNASNTAINLNRDKRLYGIPLSNYVDRYIIIKMGSVAYQNMTKVLVKGADDFTGNTTTQGYVAFTPIVIGNSTKTNKVVRVLDNYSLDIERTKYDNTIVNVNIRYGGYGSAQGKASSLIIYGLRDYMWNAINITDYSRLPFIPSANVVNSDWYDDFIDLQLNGLDKDKMERLIFIFKE